MPFKPSHNERSSVWDNVDDDDDVTALANGEEESKLTFRTFVAFSKKLCVIVAYICYLFIVYLCLHKKK